jgi:ankyrin repeat protein
VKPDAVRAASRACFFLCAVFASHAAFSGPNEDLLAAASKGELPKLERAIKKGANPDARGESKATALMVASERGHGNIVRALLRAGARADATREGGIAAIHVACATGQLDIIKELLAAGVTVNTATEKGMTPIIAAGMSGKIEVIRFLAEAGADRNAVDTGGVGLLMTSAQGGCVECMEFVRTPQSNFNALTARNFNVLDHALASRKWPAIQYVLDAGGTLSEAGRKTAMFKVIATPVDQLSRETAAEAKLIRAIVAAGAALEGINEDGLTPLLAAVKMGHVDAVEALLDGKANIAAVDKDGDGALAVAAQRDTMENLQMLLALSNSSPGSMKQIFKPAGRSDVSPATARRLAISRRLIAAGVPVNATNKEGYTPLHRAVQLGDAELVELLIGAGANVNAVNDFNTTPLMIATTWSFEAPLRSLLAAGADKTIANKKGATALSIAQENKNASVIGILEGRDVK